MILFIAAAGIVICVQAKKGSVQFHDIHGEKGSGRAWSLQTIDKIAVLIGELYVTRRFKRGGVVCFVYSRCVSLKWFVFRSPR